jgi:hypothetical protein
MRSVDRNVGLLGSGEKAAKDASGSIVRNLEVASPGLDLACDLDEFTVARAGFDDDYEEVRMPLPHFILKAHMIGCGTNIDLCYYDGPSIE